MSEFRSVVTEFSRIGNNLNQIAKYYNGGGIESQEMESEIRRCIKQFKYDETMDKPILDVFRRRLHFQSVVLISG